MFRFIHTGDLHLDSPLASLSAQQDPRVGDIVGAGRRAFDDLCALALKRRVDALVIAGDFWDGDWSDMSVGFYVQDKIGELARAGIKVVAVLGNHDAQSRVTERVRELSGLTVFPSDRAASVAVGDALIHGVSYAVPHVRDNLVPLFPAAESGKINVGVLHTGLDGSRGHGVYAPTTLAELSAKAYDYFALGHVHTRAILQAAPAATGGTIAYCGVLQGRHARETGVKGAYLVTIASPGAPAECEAIDLNHVAWIVQEVPVGRAPIRQAMEDALTEALAGTPADLAVVRLVLKGETPDHHALSVREGGLFETARMAAGAVDNRRLIVEAVRLQTAPPRAQTPRLPSHFEDDLLGASRDPRVLEEAAAAVAEILNQLPPEASEHLAEIAPELDAFVKDGDLKDPLQSAAGQVIARLSDGGTL